MKYRKLDENGDYVFGNNSYDYIEKDEAIAQAIKTKLYLFYGEWWEDISLGLPMFQSILGQVSNNNLRQTVILLCAEQINLVEGVTSVDSISVDISARKLGLTIDVTTENGTTVNLEVELNNGVF
jgi:hypothetical protein